MPSDGMIKMIDSSTTLSLTDNQLRLATFFSLTGTKM